MSRRPDLVQLVQVSRKECPLWAFRREEFVVQAPRQQPCGFQPSRVMEYTQLRRHSSAERRIIQNWRELI
jgi:hypothetical protein